MRYTRAQQLLTFAIGTLIAYQGVPTEVKAKVFVQSAIPDLAVAVLLGGLYALEKLNARPHGDEGEKRNG